jgi:uncharacterized protein (DUF433 family)
MMMITGADIMALKWQDYIEERKDVMLGKPVFKGTRLTVEPLLRELGTGISHDERFDNYPNLKPEHIQTARSLLDTRTSKETRP